MPCALDPSSSASRKCLRELRNICGTRGIFPTSYTIPSDRLTTGPDPFAQGGYGDVYEGTLDGSKVCIKRVRMYIQEGPENALQVHHRFRCSPCPPLLTKLTDLLPRGCDVEAVDTSKHLTPAGHYYYTVPARFKLDGWWGPTGVHQEEPRCRAAWTRGCPSCRVYSLLTCITSYATSLRASATSIPVV